MRKKRHKLIQELVQFHTSQVMEGKDQALDTINKLRAKIGGRLPIQSINDLSFEPRQKN